MNEWYPLASCIRLRVEGRISEKDAQRQERTARAILQRLANQPGLVLADEVGMGKTFVALAVAASVALSDKQRRPVVVMIPPSLKRKWPDDFRVFAEKCLSREAAPEVRAASADSAVEFLKLLDDSPERRNSIIFLTHGAMHRGLGYGQADSWVKLAVIQRAMKGRHHTTPIRRSLYRCLGKLLWLQWVERRAEDIWEKLLDHTPDQWLRILHRRGIDPEGDANPATDDDPVPQTIVQVLHDFDTTAVYEVLRKIPQRHSATYDARILETRRVLVDELKKVWRQCLTRLMFRLPLLVMDEAHHLKNPDAQLSGLFQNPDAKGDAEEITRGPLGGVFERMLFLTATPFQLGHHELCSVLERFEGIAWDSPSAPGPGRAAFQRQLRELRQRLDAAQVSALNLDTAWGTLRPEDLVVDGRTFAARDIDKWWAAVPLASGRTPTADRILTRYQSALERMREAQVALQPWVIRHLRERVFNGVARRERIVGRGILDDTSDATEAGMEVSGDVLLPFLLAARATACSPETRPVFAEGLASSYEAFLHTRTSTTGSTDGDDDDTAIGNQGDSVGNWYIERLEQAVRNQGTSSGHPKVVATAERVLQAWRQGEKVLVFCHYVQTGRVLRQAISQLMADEIRRRGAQKLGCPIGEVEAQLERMGKRFFDVDSPVRQACDAQVSQLLSRYTQLRQHGDLLQEITRRFLRTPSFLVRFFPLATDKLDAAAVEVVFGSGDGSGLRAYPSRPAAL
jgi:hypothetical protein